MAVTYKRDLTGVDWAALKEALREDRFDNGRTPDQLQRSFEHSYSTCLACIGSKVVGTVRAISDGVCNAYIVDVWTLSTFRRRGIARTMMELVLKDLPGQHVYLFTDDRVDFYRTLGFQPRPTGMELVVGQWLVNDPAP